MKRPDCTVCTDDHDCGGHWAVRVRPHAGTFGTRAKLTMDVYDSAHLTDNSSYQYEDEQ